MPAEGISRAARSADLRRRVHAGELCIASPDAPDAPFRTGNAMGRNKIVYALSQVTFVVSAAPRRPVPCTATPGLALLTAGRLRSVAQVVLDRADQQS